nr:TetR/AcrR family transcriptional regulator [Sphingomonas sp. Y57]
MLDAATNCFWERGYCATSMRDLIDRTGLTSASLYNAFGDKRALFQASLNHFIGQTIYERIERCEEMAPREAIRVFFEEVVGRSLEDRQHKGCMLVNTALEVAPHDAGIQRDVAAALRRIESFFERMIRAGQADCSIDSSAAPEDLASHLLGVLMGLRVLSRVRPEPGSLRALVQVALTALAPSTH